MADASLTVADWATLLTGGAAFAGLVFAGIEVKRSADQREEDRNWRNADKKEYRASMARAVSMDVETFTATAAGKIAGVAVTVHNSGSFPVGERVQAWVPKHPMPIDYIFQSLPHEVTIYLYGTVAAGQDKRHTAGLPEMIDEVEDALVILTFFDTWGQQWVKEWNGSLVAYGEPELPYPHDGVPLIDRLRSPG